MPQLPLDEAAERLAVTRHDLFKLIEEGDIPLALTRDGRLMISIEESTQR
jgi:predicted site-specific integrase-resolvase